MNPRICFLINSLSVGGAERVFIDDANALWSEGWDVRFILLLQEGPLAHELELPEERVHCLAAESIFDRKARAALITVLREYDIDTLYTTLNESNLIGRLVKFRLPRLRLVTREANHAGAKGFVHVIADMLLGLNSDRIIGVSQAVCDSIAAYAPWLRSRMRVVYNGTALPLLEKKVTGGTRLLTIGSLTEKKDQSILLDALALLPDKFTLTVVGSGPLRTRLEERAQRLGVRARVTFEGTVAHERIGGCYLAHDIFVLPSKREGCPNVVLEARAYGIPVVAFAIPGMREFIAEGTGTIIEGRSAKSLADGIRGMAGSIGRLASFGRAAREDMRQCWSAEHHRASLKKALL